MPLDHVRTGVDTSKLVRVEAGIRLQELAVQLARRGLALSNLGGFTKQTLAGVMSTATHGAGLTHSSFSDIVVSVDIVCVDANHQAALHRFEPRGGITDPATFPNAATLLHQDDEAFHAMVVSCGMLGIVYAYTVQVVDLYFVRETLADDALRDLEALLPKGRPHWGQMHWFQRPVQQHYPDSWGPWLNYYRRYNATGLFNSPITDRLNISV